MSGGFALLRAFCQWKIEHQVDTVLFLHSVLVNVGVARGCQGGYTLPGFF